MKPLFQTKFYPNGNCFSTCIACLLEVDINAVIPIENYYHPKYDWGTILRNWLKKRGYQLLPINHLENNDFYIVSGKSPRYEAELHAVIYRGGTLYHDPHPSGAGIKAVDGILALTKIC